MQRLSMAQCPACDRPSADDACACAACGSPLVMRCPACQAINVRTRSACHRCHAALRPATLAWPVLDDVLAPPPATGPDAAAGAGPEATATAPVNPGHPATDVPAAAPHRQAKAERRARVRQRQLRALQPAAAGMPGDVLVLERDAASRAALCTLLEVFGFRPHLAVSDGEALGLSVRRRYAAVLLGVDPLDGDAPALCQRLRRLPAFGQTPVFGIGDPPRHADRVRMQLAGADGTLLRPVSRGALARALQDHGVALPRDPRQGGLAGPA